MSAALELTTQSPAQSVQFFQPKTHRIHDEMGRLAPAKLDAGMVFNGKPNGKPVNGFKHATCFTPAIDPNYIFQESFRDLAVWFMAPPEPIYLWGPTGAGKTSQVKQIAGRLKYPVFEVNAHGRLDFESLCGHLTYKDGNMNYQYGALTLAMLYGGLFLLNEIDIADPAILSGLNTVLDGSPLCLTENDGELIVPHENFRFVATANTNGNSDDSGMYQGVLKQNMAFLDRFWTLHIEYPTVQTEATLLAKVAPSIPEVIRDRMIAFANDIRKQFVEQKVELTFSTRSLIRWADLTVRFQGVAKMGHQPVRYALNLALASRGSLETQEVMRNLLDTTFDKSMLNLKVNQTAASNHRQVIDWNFARESLKDLINAQKADPRALKQYFSYHTPTVYLEHASSSGGKWWECKADPRGVHIAHGKQIGTQKNSLTVPLDRCKDGNPLKEMMIRCEKKIVTDGYSLIAAKTSIPALDAA